MKFPITKKAFRAWLESHELDEVVGYRNNIVTEGLPCPVYRCFGKEAYWSDDFPRWAEYYAGKLDESGDFGTKVTARKAIEILDSIR